MPLAAAQKQRVAGIGFYLNATMQLDNWMHACIHTSPCHPLAMAKCEFGIRNENMSKSEAKANYLKHAKRRAQHVQIHPISNSYTYIHTYIHTQIHNALNETNNLIAFLLLVFAHIRRAIREIF